MKRDKKKLNNQQLINGLTERHAAQIIRRKMTTKVVPSKKKRREIDNDWGGDDWNEK